MSEPIVYLNDCCVSCHGTVKLKRDLRLMGVEEHRVVTKALA